MGHQHRDTSVAIIGLGYVGLPLSIQFARSGIRVLGLDIDARKPAMLNAGTSYIKHIDAEAIRSVVGSGMFRASSDFALIRCVDAVIICVPTPLNRHREPDMSYIVQTGHSIAPYLVPGTGQTDDACCSDRDCQSWLDSDPTYSASRCKLVVLEIRPIPEQPTRICARYWRRDQDFKPGLASIWPILLSARIRGAGIFR